MVPEWLGLVLDVLGSVLVTKDDFFREILLFSLVKSQANGEKLNLASTASISVLPFSSMHYEHNN